MHQDLKRKLDEQREEEEEEEEAEDSLLELILTGAEVVVGQLLKRGPVVVDVPAQQMRGNR